MKNFDSSLYFITSSEGISEDDFLKKIDGALRGGVSLLQLREKDKTTREYLHLAKEVHKLSQRYNVPLIIDDRIDVAEAIEAEGVHLGQSDMPIEIARKLLGDKFIIGATAKTVAQAREAFEQGADYLGVGAIFPTKTKVKTVLTSTTVLSDICRSVPIPVNAIGGLNKRNIDVLQGIPISGICVVSAIMDATNSEIAASELKQSFSKIKNTIHQGETT